MEHDHLIAMLNRLKLTAIRDQLDSLVDEAARRELTIREALSLFCEREIARKDERRIEMGIGLARFPFVRDLDSFDLSRNRWFEDSLLEESGFEPSVPVAKECLIPPPRRRSRDLDGDVPGQHHRSLLLARSGASVRRTR